MAQENVTKKRKSVKEALLNDENFLKDMVQLVCQMILENEMEIALGASPYERVEGRKGYRSGYKPRRLYLRVGEIELRIPQDRNGLFSTQLFEQYQRSEKALLTSLAEMYIQGVSTRKVKEVTEQLCGIEFSAQQVSLMTKQLDGELKAFQDRRLQQGYPYVYFDARYEKIRINGVVKNRAVLLAIGVNEKGYREVLGVDIVRKETTHHWKEFLVMLKARGLTGVKLVISDNHEGLRQAIAEVFTNSLWQRCYVHWLRNALDYLPKKGADEVISELRWIYQSRSLEEAKRKLASWLNRWYDQYPKLCTWAEETIEDTWAYFQFPEQHHKHIRSTNVLERFNEEIKRRTRVIRIFPNEDSCLRLVTALCVEVHEEWMDGTSFLNMELSKKELEEAFEQRLVA